MGFFRHLSENKAQNSIRQFYKMLFFYFFVHILFYDLLEQS